MKLFNTILFFLFIQMIKMKTNNYSNQINNINHKQQKHNYRFKQISFGQKYYDHRAFSFNTQQKKTNKDQEKQTKVSQQQQMRFKGKSNLASKQLSLKQVFQNGFQNNNENIDNYFQINNQKINYKIDNNKFKYQDSFKQINPQTPLFDQKLNTLIKKKSKCDNEEIQLRKDTNVNRLRFSTGQASYFYDGIDELLLESYKQEIQEDFNFFKQLSINGGKRDQKSFVDEQGLRLGINKSQWEIPNVLEEKDYVFIYSQSEYNNYLNMREFVFLENTFVSQRAKSNLNCTHCLSRTKQSIIELFNFIDCTQLGYIDSTMIFFGINNLQINSKITTTMVNDFVIKNMEFRTAQLDLRDFMYGIMMGMMERIIPGMDQISLQVLDMMKEARVISVKEKRNPLR